MTAICSGGTSSAKPGIAPTIFISSSAAGALLNNVPTLWAVPLAAYIGALTYEASTFCASDPPADPGITAVDIVNLLAGPLNPGAGAAAQKVAQLVSRYAWYQFCQCDTVTTPAPPTPPTEPSGAPQIDPTYLPSTKSGACTDIQGTKAAQSSTSATTMLIGLFGAANDTNKPRLAPGATLLRWTLTCDRRPPPSGNNITGLLNVFNSAGTNILARSHAFNSTSTIPLQFQETVAVPADATWMESAFIFNFADGLTYTMTSHAEFFCGTTPNTPALDCCPPDPSLAAKVEQILGYVTLIQRQISPFASIDGDAHTGLTGNGHIDVSEKMLGVRVQLTTIPNSYGREDGDPVEYFDLGFVSLGDGDQWFGQRQLDHSTVIWQPRWSGMATRIGYTLSPGVAATVTELHREA